MRRLYLVAVAVFGLVVVDIAAEERGADQPNSPIEPPAGGTSSSALSRSGGVIRDMDGLTLLRRTHEAGLKVAVEGDKLVIRGPKRAEPVARLLIECKLEVMAALALRTIDCLYASEVTCAAASDRRNAESADKSAHVTNPRWWRNLFAERAAHYEFGGKRLRAEAEHLAYRECIAHWRRLFGTALARLRAGETLVWRHNPSSFEKDSTVTLSRSGIHIQQIGVIFNKDVSIEWSVLKFTQVNGSSKFQNYKTREHVTINTWRMRDNMTFLGVVGFLVDKANYRLLAS
jgi:hypothetical protein